MKKYKNMNRNEGFTLVELMIVISIIAILAVVLVPKVGDMKNSVRNQGVASNVNSVRAFLELKVNSRASTASLESTRIQGLLTTEFVGGNSIVNPVTNGEGIGVWGNDNALSTMSIIIRNAGNVYVSDYSIDTEAYYINPELASYVGKIFVYVCTDGYIIWGKNSDKTVTSYQLIK